TPDKEKPFKLETNASQFATGTVLKQIDETGSERPVRYLSQALTPTERNYEIYNRELLGIVRALEEWRHLLEGAPHRILIRSDHQNLTYWRSAQRLNRRQARWHLFLSQFDLKLQHVPGRKLVMADTLSRLYHLDESNEDNEGITMIPDELVVHAIQIPIVDRIKNANDRDESAEQAIRALGGTGEFPARTTADEWQQTDGILLYRGRMYVP
ncbi:Ty3/Gypsy family RNase HI domain-containing protein, partial [Anoxybacillus flavithermus]|uniref:Ty3/Gypsy family RNase HI domain-containing protein n=1 Tax=Anoxybacillus flavithermus TaxID=33934 RepID=UPI0013E3C88F